MKRLILYSVLVCICNLITAQPVKTFDCGLFSFDYPTPFKPIPIQNAPHMVLKLESDNYTFSASYWDKGLAPDVSIWDDDIYRLYKQNPVGDGTLIRISKESIQTKGGVKRCLKLKTNLHRRVKGKDVYLKMVSYLMLQNGYLFTFVFVSEGKYTKDSPTTYPDKIMKGLRLKQISQVKTSDFESNMIEVIKKLNAQCPMKVDNCTTHLLVLLSGKTIMIKTLIEDSCNSLVDYNEFKKKMCENFSASLDKAFVQYLDENEYSLVYMIYNENDRLKKKVTITGRNILDHYKYTYKTI